MILRGADVNAVDSLGYTPLHYAVQSGEPLLQRLLLICRANVNAIAKDGMTPLALAIKADKEKEVETLLWLGAETSIPGVPESVQPKTLLDLMGSDEVREIVSKHEAAMRSSSRYIPTFVKNSLHEAARVGDLKKLEAFLDGGADINMQDEQGRTALHRAIAAAQDDVLFYLIAAGANPNVADKNGVTPLMSTMGWVGGSFDGMRRFLIARGAYPFAIRKNHYNELTWAVERGNNHGTQWLLWLGANGREKTKLGTPFQIAFQAGRQPIMDLLRRNGIDEPIKLSDDPVWNLHNAVKRGDHELVLKLLDEGVPVDVPDPKNGYSPLIAAIAAGNIKTAQFLIEQGADIDYVCPKYKTTPIYMTVIWDGGDVNELRETLLKAGVNPNVGLDKSGETPLMRAVWHQPTTPLKQLVQYGADLNIRNKEGLTALGIALRDGKTKTAEFLKEHGAKE